MPFVVGETIGPYRITEQLGQGGMATVFKAYHPALDRYVAIKALHPAFKEDVNFLARFQREARVVAKLDHPNIVPIYDFAEHEGRPYLVMKFIEGETLKARLAHRRLSFSELMNIVDAVGSALTYAHRQGILHRDVKPSNVLLANDGQIYLADFGLARIAAAGESTLSSDMMLGTPQYISPEQAIGKRELDEGTDIYSFGVLLYELLVGKVPFSADTPYAIIHDHIYTPLPLPHSINPKLTEDVERVLLKALAKERTDRYITVASLVESFKGASIGLEASAPDLVPGVTRAVNSPQVASEVVIPPQVGLEKGVEEIHIEESPPPEEAIHKAGILPAKKHDSGKKPFFRKWYVWLLIVAGIFWLCLCIWFGVRALNNNRAKVDQALPTMTQAQQEIKVMPDPLENARRNVEQNPNDPIVHLELAVMLIDARQFDEIPGEFGKVQELVAEPNFYADHGLRFIEQQKWIAATWAFLRMMELRPGPGTGEMRDLWHEAIYRAFMDPDTTRVIDLERIRKVDPPMAGVAQAQAELTAGNISQAEAAILEVLKQNDNFPEALLVQVRVLIRLKNPDRVGKILDGLKRNQDIPPWIREEIIRIEEVGNSKP